MSIDKRLAHLESRKQYKRPDHTNWLVEFVEKNQQGEIVVVGRHWYLADGKQLT
jgi:hypothetical protein